MAPRALVGALALPARAARSRDQHRYKQNAKFFTRLFSPQKRELGGLRAETAFRQRAWHWSAWGDPDQTRKDHEKDDAHPTNRASPASWPHEAMWRRAMCPFIPTTPDRHRAPAASRVIRPPPLEPHYVVRLRNGAVFEHRDSPPDPRADVPAVDGRSHETRAYKSDGAAGRRSVSSHPRLPAPGAWSASGPRGGGPGVRDP